MFIRFRYLITVVFSSEHRTMEIIRGSLDDISRPASGEHTGSRVSSVSSTPFALVVLSNDAADIPIQNRCEETSSSSASGPDQGRVGVKDEEKEDSELQRAINEMKHLDEILSERIFKEKEAKRERKALQTKLWHELLQNKPHGHSESAQEALNTRLFLALEASSGTEEDDEDDDFVPVFETQVPDSDRDPHGQPVEQNEWSPDNSAASLVTGEEQFENGHCGASRGKKGQKDFVKRNIELASGDGGQMILTQAEKQRLAELLRQIHEEEEEEEEDSARGGDGEEDMWAVSVLTRQGYTPEPSDLQQLIDVDSKMRLLFLLPDEEFHSVQSSYANISAIQGHGSEVGWKCDGDPQPAEKVLQDRKERRRQERRLQEIQQQLEILGQSPEMTNESSDLTEEQLLRLLDECELTELERGPRDP